jgi:dTMP kinase
MAPLFITFEGLDGSGKSTHLRWVVRHLEDRGIDHLVTHEPGGTDLGESIREVFLDPRWGALDGTVEALLVFASRRQHLLEVVDPALEAGRHVLCDRFTDSTYAYQGFGRGVELAILDEVDRLATGGRRPDRTLLFDVPAKVARNRGNEPCCSMCRPRSLATVATPKAAAVEALSIASTPRSSCSTSGFVKGISSWYGGSRTASGW